MTVTPSWRLTICCYIVGRPAKVKLRGAASRSGRRAQFSPRRCKEHFKLIQSRRLADSSRSPETRWSFNFASELLLGEVGGLAAVPRCNWECPRMPKTVTPEASLAPRYHVRRVGSRVLSSGFYFSPDHRSGGVIFSQNGKTYTLKHIIFIRNMLGHIFY